MPNWYHPVLPPTASSEELLTKWAEDNGIAIEHLNRLTENERASAYEALHSLAYFWATPVETDMNNPYWMEDEGYRDADDDTQVLNNLAMKLQGQNEVTGKTVDPVAEEFLRQAAQFASTDHRTATERALDYFKSQDDPSPVDDEK